MTAAVSLSHEIGRNDEGVACLHRRWCPSRWFPSTCGIVALAMVADDVGLTGQFVVTNGDVNVQDASASCCCTPMDCDTARMNMPEKQSACVSSRRVNSSSVALSPASWPSAS